MRMKDIEKGGVESEPEVLYIPSGPQNHYIGSLKVNLPYGMGFSQTNSEFRNEP
jgi:hypothetical protein